MMKILTILTLLVASLFGATFNVSTTPDFRQALLDAAQNGQDDTIVLADGTYKTTDDGQGTFIFLDNEEYQLTIQGSSPDRVVVSGDNTHQVLKLQSTYPSMPFLIKNLSIVNGRSDNNAAAYFSSFSPRWRIDNCIISHNYNNNSGGSVVDGNGILYGGEVLTSISSSIISHNSSGVGGTGIIIDTEIIYNSGTGVASAEQIIDSNISYNISTGWRSGGVARATTIRNTTVSFNSANIDGCTGGCSYQSGDAAGIGTVSNLINSVVSNNTMNSGRADFDASGICSAGKIQNSIIANNVSTNKGTALYQANVIENSMILNNTCHESSIGCAGQNMNIYNSILKDNTSGVTMSYRDGIIVNSVFIGNNLFDIKGDSNLILTIANNYIDPSKINATTLKSNNVFSGVTLGFVNEANDDYHLTLLSNLIDAGTTSVSGVTLPTTDLDGNVRIVGASIDIGPYEFSTTRPTITSFTYTGEAKEMSELVFDVQYSFSSGRSLGTVEFDFTGDGTYESRYAHTYTQAGTYTASVKITDNTGEFSIKSLEIIVAKISLEDKLLTVLTPSEVDTLMPWINEEVDTQVTDKIDTCKANPKSCGIKSGVVVIPF